MQAPGENTKVRRRAEGVTEVWPHPRIPATDTDKRPPDGSDEVYSRVSHVNKRCRQKLVVCGERNAGSLDDLKMTQ